MMNSDIMSGVNDLPDLQTNVSEFRLGFTSTSEDSSSVSVKIVRKVSDISAMELCCGCGRGIADKYLLRIRAESWHERCAVCSVCHGSLQETCFVREGKLFCRYDYAKLYGTRCAGCGHAIVTSELVMRALQQVYHVQCFTCSTCGTQLRKGDQFVLRDGQLLCRHDYERELATIPALASGVGGGGVTVAAPGGGLLPLHHLGHHLDGHGSEEEEVDDSDSEGGGRGGAKRPRTILTTAQRRKFKQAFEVNPKPSRKVREALAAETGLSVRVVQVWFQNQRAKVKKLARRQSSVSNNNNNNNNSGGEGAPLSGDTTVDSGKPDQENDAVYAALTTASSSGRLSGDSSDTGGCPVTGVLSENSPLGVGDLGVPTGTGVSSTPGGQPTPTQTNLNNSTGGSDPIDKLYSMHSSYFT